MVNLADWLNDDTAKKRQAIMAQKPDMSTIALSALAGLGDSITSAYGTKPTNNLGSIVQMQQAKKQQQLAELDDEKRDKVESFMLQQKAKQFAADESKREELKKTDTPLANALRDRLSKYDPGVDYASASVGEMSQILPEAQRSFYEGKKIGVQENRNKSLADLATARLAEAKAKRQEIDDSNKEKYKTNLTNQLYKRTQQGVLGDLNKMRVTANTAKGNIATFAKDPSGYSDYGTLMTSLKSLQGDSSVVREAELKLGKNATSLFNKAANSLQQAINGKSLQPSQREEIIKVMGALSSGYEDAYRKAAAPTIVSAKKAGIPLNEIFDDPTGIEAAPQMTKQVVKKGYNPTLNKTQLIYSDGTKEIVDGRQ